MCLLGAGDARVMCIYRHYQLLVTNATIVCGRHILFHSVTVTAHNCSLFQRPYFTRAPATNCARCNEGRGIDQVSQEHCERPRLSIAAPSSGESILMSLPVHAYVLRTMQCLSVLAYRD